jgi:hypothetical protein
VVLDEVRSESSQGADHEEQRHNLDAPAVALDVEDEVADEHQHECRQSDGVSREEIIAHHEGNQEGLQEEQFVVEFDEGLLVLVVVVVIVFVYGSALFTILFLFFIVLCRTKVVFLVRGPVVFLLIVVLLVFSLLFFFVEPVDQVLRLLSFFIFRNLMLVHGVKLCLVSFILLLLILLGNVLEPTVLDLFDHSIDGDHEVEDENEEENDLEQKRIYVVAAGHRDRGRKGLGVGQSLGGGREHLRNTYSHLLLKSELIQSHSFPLLKYSHWVSRLTPTDRTTR